MAIYHGEPPSSEFTRVPNAWLRDPKLSAKGKAMVGYLLSHQNGYQITAEQMVAEFAESKNTIYAMLGDAIKAGYVQRQHRRDEQGHIVSVDYLVIGVDGKFPQVGATSQEPGSGELGSGSTCNDAAFPQVTSTSQKPRSGKAGSGNLTTKKNMSKKTKDLEDQDHSLSSRSDRDSPPAQVEPNDRERDPRSQISDQQPQDPIRAILAAHGCTDTNADTVINHGNSIGDGKIKGPRWWETVERNGHLPAVIAAGLANAAWDPVSGADRGISQSAALAAKYDRLDGTNVTGTNPDGQHQDPFFAGPWITMADGGRLQHGYPTQRSNRPVGPGWKPWRDPEDLTVYNEPI